MYSSSLHHKMVHTNWKFGGHRVAKFLMGGKVDMVDTPMGTLNLNGKTLYIFVLEDLELLEDIMVEEMEMLEEVGPQI